MEVVLEACAFRKLFLGWGEEAVGLRNLLLSTVFERFQNGDVLR